MNVNATELPGVLLLEPKVHQDERGFFTEVWHAHRYAELGLPQFCQDNVAGSGRNVLRGLHYQWPRPQAKLMFVITGAVLDVAVDIRRGSPTFGRSVAVELSEANRRQLFIPEGFAHGYAVLGDRAVVSYKCSDVHVEGNDRVIRWDDPALGIPWPVANPVLSARDRGAPALADVPPDHLPGAPSAKVDSGRKSL